MRWLPMIFMFLVVTSGQVTDQDWQENKDVMDLAIGIHYVSPSTPQTKIEVDRLVEIINQLAKLLHLSQDKTRMAIMEFGDTHGVRLRIEDGIDAAKVAEATEIMGKDVLTQNSALTMKDVAEATRRTIFPPDATTDRPHVPKLVMVFTTMEHNRIGRIRNDQALQTALDEMKDTGTLVVVLDSYSHTGTVSHDTTFYAVLFPLARNKQEIPSPLRGNYTGVAPLLVAGIQRRLSQCVFKKSVAECGDRCWTNVTYQLAYRDGGRVDPTQWKEVDWFCFKEHSTEPCQCLTTSSEQSGDTTGQSGDTTVDEDVLIDPNTFFTDDPLVIRLQIGLVVMGVLMAILVPAAVISVIWARREWKRLDDLDKANRAREEGILAAKLMGWTKMQATKAQWSVGQVPDITQTPVSKVVEQFAKKK